MSERIDHSHFGKLDIPNPFQLSAIAVLMTKGKEKPEDNLEAAWDLLNAADVLIKIEREECSNDEEAALAEHNAKLKEEGGMDPFDIVKLLLDENDDEARKFLRRKGVDLQKHETVIKNLLKFYKDTNNKKERERILLEKANGNVIRVSKSDLTKIAEIKKGRKSKGGTKSYKTRLERQRRKKSSEKK